jgi:hypothetical protein
MNATSSSSTAPGPTDRVGAPSSSSLWRPALGVSRVGNQVRQHCRCDRAARRVPSAMSGQPKDGSPETRREWRCTRLSSSSRPGRWRSKPSLSVRVGRSACAEGAGDDSHPRTLPPGLQDGDPPVGAHFRTQERGSEAHRVAAHRTVCSASAEALRSPRAYRRHRRGSSRNGADPRGRDRTRVLRDRRRGGRNLERRRSDHGAGRRRLRRACPAV